MSGAASSWRSLLLRIGDKCAEYGGGSDYREHIETCYGVIWREFENSKDAILEHLMQCAEQLPHKVPFYAVLVGLINLENEEFGKKVVETTHANLQEALQAENCNRIRILLRFLSALVSSKVIAPSTVIEAFETLLSSAAKILDENSLYQFKADFYVYCILASLPWAGTELMEQVPDELERVMVGVESYLSIRTHCDDVSFSFFESDEINPTEEKDYIEDLWDRVKLLSQNGWKAISVPRPQLSFEAQLVAGKSHNLSPIICADQPIISSNPKISKGQEKHEAGLKYPQRLRRLSIFPSNKAENMKPIDRFVVEEYLLDVLLFFNGCRKECAFYLAGLPVPFRYEFIMAETIFSQLLLLPQPPFKPIYYTLVILDLCKALPGAFPAVVVGAVRALFNKITNMDMECRNRLILWFSHHLSNCQYIWPWQEWAYVKDLPKWAPQRVFVQEVLEREIRLSYWDKIKQSIEDAPALEELLPPKSSTESTLLSESEISLSKELISLIKTRKFTSEISAWVSESVPEPKLALKIVAQTLLEVGAKSFTHLITVLERYGQVLSELCRVEESRSELQLMDEVAEHWRNSKQMTAVTIDRIMGYRLVSNLAIVEWVFGEKNVGMFHVSDRPWEVLRNAVNKTCNRTSDLRKEISSLENSLEKSIESSSKTITDLEEARSAMEINLETEPTKVEKPARVRRLEMSLERSKREEKGLREKLETKRGLLAHALDESKALFKLLFKSFVDALTERLPPVSSNREIPNLRAGSGNYDSAPVDLEKPASMDVDDENGEKEMKSEYKIGEMEQWCLSTLGYLKAFSRQYATEIWPHIETLDSEVFNGEIHPLILKAAFSGLGRPTNDW